MLPDPLVLRPLLHAVRGGQWHRSAVAAQNRLAPAHVGGLQGEAAAVLAGSHRVVSDVTQGRRTPHPLARRAQLPAGERHAETQQRERVRVVALLKESN